MKDKQSVAVKLYDLKNRERLIKSLSISPRTFDGWVSNKAKQLKQEKEEETISLYLHAELTQKDVADNIGTSRENVNDIINKCGKNCNTAEFTKSLNFTPFLYNIWNSSKIKWLIHATTKLWRDCILTTYQTFKKFVWSLFLWQKQLY